MFLVKKLLTERQLPYYYVKISNTGTNASPISILSVSDKSIVYFQGGTIYRVLNWKYDNAKTESRLGSVQAVLSKDLYRDTDTEAAFLSSYATGTELAVQRFTINKKTGDLSIGVTNSTTYDTTLESSGTGGSIVTPNNGMASVISGNRQRHYVYGLPGAAASISSIGNLFTYNNAIGLYDGSGIFALGGSTTDTSRQARFDYVNSSGVRSTGSTVSKGLGAATMSAINGKWLCKFGTYLYYGTGASLGSSSASLSGTCKLMGAGNGLVCVHKIEDGVHSVITYNETLGEVSEVQIPYPDWAANMAGGNGVADYAPADSRYVAAVDDANGIIAVVDTTLINE